MAVYVNDTLSVTYESKFLNELTASIFRVRETVRLKHYIPPRCWVLTYRTANPSSILQHHKQLQIASAL